MPLISRLNCVLIIVFTIQCTSVETARILLLTAPIYSHCKSLGAIGKSLDSINHDVFAFIPNQWEAKDCLDERHIKILKYEGDSPVRSDEKTLGSSNEREELKYISNKLCSSILSDENNLKRMATMKFDLVIADTFPASRCYLLIPYRLNIPYVSFCALHWWFDTGKPFSPQLEIPVFSSPGEMTLRQRVQNAFVMLTGALVMPWYFRGDAEVNFAPELSLYEYMSLIRKSVLFIQDDDVIMSGPIPEMPNTVYTGGFSPRPAKPLPQEINKFLSSAKDGVIVVSFGSFTNIPENVIRAMRDVFSSSTHNILIKTKQDFQLPNVKTLQWIPQNDVLGHNKTKLFISHCGRNGAYEAIYHGVPVMCIPGFGDQPLVAFNLERLHMGISVDIKSLNTDHFRSALSTVLSKTFEKNAKHASSLYQRIHQKSAGDTAAHAIDLVIKYGGDHLRPEAMDLSIFSFLLLDIWLLLLGVVVSVSVTSWLCCRLAYRALVSRKVKQE